MDEHSKFLADQLATGLQETKKIVMNLEKEVHTSAVAAAGINATMAADIRSIKDTVESLEKIIRDPTTNSLTNRVSTLESEVKTIRGWVNEKKDVDKGYKTEDRRGKWQMRAVMISSSVSFIIALATILFNVLTR